jgi:L-fuconolactonase
LIDAHVHVWRIGENGCAWPGADLAAIHRDYALADFRAAAGPEIEAVLLVQSQEDAADTDWLLGIQDPLIAGVVGWTDLTAPDAAERVCEMAKHPRLKGLRPMVQDCEAGWYDRANDSALAAMAESKLVLDALVRPRHLDSLARLAARHAGLHIVVDHAAKPDFGDLAMWERGICEVARHSNVRCKVSGLFTEENAVVTSAFGPIWQAFGPERLIWGSDWPVLDLAASYGAWLAIARDLVPAEHRDAVFGGNARRTYRL